MNLSTLNRIHIASIAVLLTTIIHHIYGGIVYSTPERYHVVFIAVPAILVQFIALSTYRNRSGTTKGKLAAVVFYGVVFFVSIGLFGIIEGGYNHLVKIVLYYGGAPVALLDRLYSSPIYVMPDDFIFETTGVAQFFIGAYAAYYVAKLRKETRIESGKAYNLENI